jgi:hypothetical protein
MSFISEIASAKAGGVVIFFNYHGVGIQVWFRLAITYGRKCVLQGLKKGALINVSVFSKIATTRQQKFAKTNRTADTLI